MKHVFVINPRAGKVDRVEEITETLKQMDGTLDYDVYETKARGDAGIFVKDYLETHDPKETYRFYSCGGDGTLNDVANGAFGHDNAEIACLACGSGNDFIKNFGDGEEFRNIKCLIKGVAKPVDLIKVNNKVCVNIFSFGFDGEVTLAMHKYKRLPLVTGKMAYSLAALRCLLFKMKNVMKITVDDEVIYDGNALLVAVCNGSIYGGGFKVAPIAEVNDGLLDVCMARTVSRFKAPGLMAKFKKGEHLDNPKFDDIVIYKRGKKVLIESPHVGAYQVDGENFEVDRLEAEIVPNGMKFVIPEPIENQMK